MPRYSVDPQVNNVDFSEVCDNCGESVEAVAVFGKDMARDNPSLSSGVKRGREGISVCPSCLIQVLKHFGNHPPAQEQEKRKETPRDLCSVCRAQAVGGIFDINSQVVTPYCGDCTPSVYEQRPGQTRVILAADPASPYTISRKEKR
jgi:hypothetical protein